MQTNLQSKSTFFITLGPRDPRLSTSNASDDRCNTYRWLRKWSKGVAWENDFLASYTGHGCLQDGKVDVRQSCGDDIFPLTVTIVGELGVVGKINYESFGRQAVGRDVVHLESGLRAPSWKAVVEWELNLAGLWKVGVAFLQPIKKMENICSCSNSLNTRLHYDYGKSECTPTIGVVVF